MYIHKTKFDVEKYFDVKLKLLRWFSVWPLKSKSMAAVIFQRFMFSVRCSALIIASIGQFVQLYLLPRLDKISSLIATVTVTTSSAYKSAFMVIHHDQYRSLLRAMENKFVEESLVPIPYKPTTKMNHYLRHTDAMACAYSFAGALSAILWCFAPILSSHPSDDFFEPDPDCIYRNETCAPIRKPQLPFKIWIPFDYTWTPMYQILFAYLLIFPLLDCACYYMVQDGFLFMNLYTVCGQFDILRDTLVNVGKCLEYQEQGIATKESNALNNNEDLDGALMVGQFRESKEKFLTKVLEECVELHVSLLQFLRDYEKLMQTMIIVDFLHAIISLSFAFVELFDVDNVIEYTRMVLYLMVCVGHQFLNSFFGEMVIQKQLSLAEAAYHLPWEKCSIRFKKSVMLIVQRTKQPIVLNGLKMYFLTHQTFVEFMKALVSYYGVLRTLKDDNKLTRD